MIRVPIPIDVATVAITASSAFALATPLRVDELVMLAVREAVGRRAPPDLRNRSIRRALEGLRAGDFVVDVDGRTCASGDNVVLCAGTAVLRFFSTGTRSKLRLR